MQEFIFSAPAKAQMLNYMVIGAVVIGGVIGIAFSETKAKRIMTAVVMIPVLFFLWRIMMPASSGTKVVLGETMTVVSGYGKMEIAKGDVISATVVSNLGTDPNLHPTMKTNAAAMGDYRLGWFLLADGKKAFIMSATPQVMAIELKDNWVIVAPKDFEQFVKAVNDGFVPVK